MKKTSNTAGNKLDKTGGKITGSLDVSDILTVNGKLVLDEDNYISDLVNYVTTSISVTSTTAEQTILSTILEKKGLYLLVGSIPLNNYGLQTGRELYIKVKINNSEVFAQLWVINSEVYTLSRTIAVLFCTTSINSELKITIQNSTSNKNWSCPSGVLQLARLK